MDSHGSGRSRFLEKDLSNKNDLTAAYALCMAIICSISARFEAK